MRKGGRCDSGIYNEYCGSSELVVEIASVGKLPDLHAFDRGQIVSVQRIGHSIAEIVTQLGFSRSTMSRLYQEYMDGGQKTSNRANCKGQLALQCEVSDGSGVLYVASETKY
ncbi:uncharacterized protein TNCV_4484741 [Trichonephila clavipes]|nr:uncharacterized protein TNCV_4484741 [Trichonephila clavipes]